jgi:hypothetical protein
MTGAAPTDFDITLAARSMIRVYGRDAAAEARRRADAEDAHRATWVRILAAIERLQAEMPEPEETVQ